MKTTALIEKGKDGTFGIFTPDINATIIGEGATVAEAKTDFEQGAKEMILSYTDAGERIPEELRDIEFEYKYDVASVFDYLDCLNVSKFAKLAGINDSQMRHYKKGNWYISAQQAAKIEKALHDLGQAMLSVSL